MGRRSVRGISERMNETKSKKKGREETTTQKINAFSDQVVRAALHSSSGILMTLCSLVLRNPLFALLRYQIDNLHASSFI